MIELIMRASDDFSEQDPRNGSSSESQGASPIDKFLIAKLKCAIRKLPDIEWQVDEFAILSEYKERALTIKEREDLEELYQTYLRDIECSKRTSSTLGMLSLLSDGKNVPRKKNSVLSAGSSDFREYIQQEFVHIDKTDFISHFLGYFKDRYNFSKLTQMIRPAGFGKSLNVSMLYYFLTHHIDEKPNDMQNVFYQLKVGQDARTMAHFAKHVVVYFNMRNMQPHDKKSAYDEILHLMRDLYGKFEYLLTSNHLTKYQKDDFENILNGSANATNIRFSLKDLIEVLAAHHRKTDERGIILLIDEFDAPLTACANNREMQDVIKDFLYAGLNECPYERALLTGMIPLKESGIFSKQLPAHSPYTLLCDNDYTCDFGMTVAELRQLLTDTGKYNSEIELQATMEKLTDWYGGYRVIADNKQVSEPLFRCRSVSLALFNQNYQCYWELPKSDTLLHDKIAAYEKENPETYLKLKTRLTALISGQSVLVRLGHAEDFWSMLLSIGLITVNGCYEKKDDLIYDVILPNEECRINFKNLFEKMCEPDSDSAYDNPERSIKPTAM